MAVVLLFSWGCGQRRPGPDSQAVHVDSGPTPPPGPARSNAQIIADAESLYTYGPERSQLTVRDPDFKGPYVQTEDSLPRMSIATAILKDSVHQPATRIIARITSDRAYPNAGVDAGHNYVWRSSWKRDSAAVSSWVTMIVSHDTLKKAYVLTRDSRKQAYTHGEPLEPRLVRVRVHSVAFGACFDDPMCSSGHCGYY